MQACLEFPSALITDFGFLHGDLLEIALKASSAAKANHEKFATTLSGGDKPNTSAELNVEWTTGEIEIEILDVFAKLSNVKRSMIGLQTTIFRLGLDSISAVQIAAHLRQKGRKISPIEVLEVKPNLSLKMSVIDVFIAPHRRPISVVPPNNGPNPRQEPRSL